MISETEIEMGPQGTNVVQANGKMGQVSDLTKSFYKSYKRAIEYLKNKGLLARIASKENYDSSDLSFKSNGDVIVSFDDGGNLRIPSKVLDVTVQPNQRKGFLNGLLQQFSICTKELKEENYFQY